jgi:hypothetical protein
MDFTMDENQDLAYFRKRFQRGVTAPRILMSTSFGSVCLAATSDSFQQQWRCWSSLTCYELGQVFFLAATGPVPFCTDSHLMIL